jgi:Zn-dependent metalloprotease
MKKFNLLVFSSAVCIMASAQPSLQKMKASLDKTPAAGYTYLESTPTQASVHFKEGRSLSKVTIKDWLTTSLQLRKGQDEINVSGSETNYGPDITVQKFQQYYKGIKVEHGIINSMSKKGRIENLQMEFHPVKDNMSTVPSISEQAALQKAKDFIGAAKYSWEGYTGDDPLYQRPVGELVYVEDFFKRQSDLHLAYKFRIYADVPLSGDYIYVDAEDGRVLLQDRIIKHLDTDKTGNRNEMKAAGESPAPGFKNETETPPFTNMAGTADTRYSGTTAFITDFTGTNYRLRQVRNSHNIITLDYARRVQSGANNLLATDFTDNDNNWTTAEHVNNYDDAALDVQYAMQFISDYWKNIHGRNSWNNANGDMKSYVHIRATAGAGYDNAFWGGDAMYYGDGTYLSTTGNGAVSNVNGFLPLTSLDVSAHELGHAVCATTANLVYQRESGGMNEGFSDIWAACVENFSGLPKNVWLMGEELLPSSTALRSMQNPKMFGNPDTYGGQFWQSVTLPGCPIPGQTTNDYCGVHGNSGVLNKWFYLVTQGAVGTNDRGDSYNISGLGFVKSEKIAYLAELNLTPNATFASARTASINAATALFGACSNEVIQVTNAWFGVGVGGSSDCTPQVEFVKTLTSIAEGNGLNGNCAVTKSVPVSVKLGNIATQATDITFAIAGTAIQGVDYTISPATITFAPGETGVKNVTLTINDDATIEPNETIILSYNINAHLGNATAGVNNQTHTVTITDDDTPPLPLKGTAVSYPVLINEDFESSPNGVTYPAGWATNLAFSGGASINTWAIGTNGGAGITGKAAYITNSAAAPNPPFAYTLTSATDRLLRFPVLNTTGLSDIKLKFRYKVGGEVDASALWDYARVVFDAGGTGLNFPPLIDPATNEQFALYGDGTTAIDFTTLTLPSSMNNKPAVYLGLRWANDAAAGTAIPLLIDDVVVTARSMGTAVETQATQSNSINLVSGSGDAYLASTADTQLIAKVKNLDQNVPCVTVQLAQAGNGLTPLNFPFGSFMRTQKVITMSPATPNTTATYQGTLYYSVAELAAWGANDVNLKIAKIKDGVSLAGTVNPTNTELITPTSVVKDVANGIISYTANFTGFSQFVLVAPNATLPVDLVSFDAKAAEQVIKLDWTTAQEINNIGFGVERSSDGVNFMQIGWVAGQINSNSRTDYNFQDNFVQAGAVYYYRLRQVDVDGHDKFSMVRQARIAGSGLFLSLSPNPASGFVNLFVSGHSAPLNIDVMNAQGQVIRSWKKVTTAGGPVKLDISGFAGGLYMFSVQFPGETRIEKLLIK